MFSHYIRNVPIEDDEIMVSFDVTSLYTNIPITDTLNIIKDYVNSDDQFIRKTAINQDKFLDLVHLVLTTTWYTFNSQFYPQIDGVAMGGPASSTTSEIYMQTYERAAITTALHPPKIWEQFVDDVHSILKRTHLENFLHKENARIKQVLKKNGYREIIINKIFRRITNYHSLPQSQHES